MLPFLLSNGGMLRRAPSRLAGVSYKIFFKIFLKNFAKGVDILRIILYNKYIS